jgi:hypothetical protein
MSSWEGERIDTVIQQWGYPTEEREFRGNKLYIWVYSKSAYVPQSSRTTASVYGNSIYAQTDTYGGYTLHGTCVRILEVNDDGEIVRWEWKGNNCPFLEAMGYSDWRKK